jgi:hypothetical protein
LRQRHPDEAYNREDDAKASGHDPTVYRAAYEQQRDEVCSWTPEAA